MPPVFTEENHLNGLDICNKVADRHYHHMRRITEVLDSACVKV
jgi:hypothetical protein